MRAFLYDALRTIGFLAFLFQEGCSTTIRSLYFVHFYASRDGSRDSERPLLGNGLVLHQLDALKTKTISSEIIIERSCVIL